MSFAELGAPCLFFASPPPLKIPKFHVFSDPVLAARRHVRARCVHPEHSVSDYKSSPLNVSALPCHFKSIRRASEQRSANVIIVWLLCSAETSISCFKAVYWLSHFEPGSLPNEPCVRARVDYPCLYGYPENF